MTVKTYINLIFATVGTSLGFLLGGWDKLLIFLVTLVVIDYITGIMKGYKNKMLSSSICYRGIAKKVCIFCIIVVVAQFDSLGLSQTPILRTTTIWFYIGNEFISLLENFTELGVPVPEILKNKLQNIKPKNNG